MLVAILGGAAIGAVALAQDGEDGDGFPFNFRERLHATVADILGISVDEYDAALESAQEQVLGEAVTDGWLTQDQADRMRDRMDEGFGRGTHDGFPGIRGDRFGHGRGSFVGGPENSLVGVAAEELDITAPELLEELRDGKSIAEVASEKDVEPQSIAVAYLAQLEENLNQAVEDGRITQKQADWMLTQAQEGVTDQLENTGQLKNTRQLKNTGEGCRPGGTRGSGRPSRFRDFPGQGES
jgi:hypothetical protein